MPKPKRTTPIKADAAKPVVKTAPKQPDTDTTVSTSKLDTIVTLLKRPKGATMQEMMEATGWQRHSIHGTLSGTIKKKRGLPLITEFGERGRSYRIGVR